MFGAGQVMEQGDMGSQKVTLGREMGVAEPVQPGLVVGGEGQAEDQRRRVERWLELTRVTLPGVAAARRWPIRLDHCFMRVLLDNAVGGVWHRVIARPAIRHISPATLEQAIALGHRVLQEPELLPELDRRSLAWRGHRPL